MKREINILGFFLLVFGVAQMSRLQAQLPKITSQPASRALWAGGNAIFTVSVSNAGSFTYQWQLNSTNLPNGIITTVAGNGSADYFGDGSAATSASLNYPSGVAVDGAGNLFIADFSNSRIRKVDTNGIVTTVAGGGFAGDGGAATNSSLNSPFGVTVTAADNLFIADMFNNRIRKVDADGIITTVAGNGTIGYSGNDGAATNANLAKPQGVAFDNFGNMFIADTANNWVRNVNSGSVITAIAGKAQQGLYSGDGGFATNACLNHPFSLAVDAIGNVFIADCNNNRIREVSTNGVISTVAGSGSVGIGNGSYSGDGFAATNASLNGPSGVVVDTLSNLFIVDNFNNRIRKVDANGIITTVAGNGTNAYTGDGFAATNASLNFPFGMTIDGFGNLFIADTDNHRIRKVTNTQGPVLALNNVTAANEGNYQVIITGAGGSVTSSIVNLIVASSPLIYQTVRNTDGSIALNSLSQPGSTNVVLCAINLSPPIFWLPLSTNLAGADGNWQFTDTNAADFQTRFYRSLTQ